MVYVDAFMGPLTPYTMSSFKVSPPTHRPKSNFLKNISIKFLNFSKYVVARST